MILSEDEARERAIDVLVSSFGKLIRVPIKMVAICRAHNIRVWERPLRDVDSLAFRDRDGSLGIVINCTVFHVRRHFSFAHELGHIFCDHIFLEPPDYYTYRQMERVANSFAAELMMPSKLATYQTWTVGELAKACGVSYSAAKNRLEEWGLTG